MSFRFNQNVGVRGDVSSFYYSKSYSPDNPKGGLGGGRWSVTSVLELFSLLTIFHN